MADPPYRASSIADLERPDGWSPLRIHLGVRSFGVNAWTTHEAGAVLITEHDERPSGHEELYLVTSGRATFTVAGEEVDVPAGSAIFVPDPAVRRAAVAAAADTTVVAMGGRPGAVYAPRAWETNTDAIALLNADRDEEAKAVLLAALERYQDTDILLYNLACAESKLGETDAAIAHLQSALEQRPSFAELARTDPDLEGIRADPRFAELVG